MHIPTPEYHTHEEFRNRCGKLNEIRTLGIEPYPAKFTPTDTAANLLEKYREQELTHDDAAEGKNPEATIAGRLILFRAMGKNAFGQIKDASGKLQIMFNRDLTKVHGLPEDSEIRPIKFIEKKLDLGDIIGIKGHLFYTGKGELTLFAKEVTLLCKTLLPLPDKHSGLTDKGVRYRKRWIDLISNDDSRNVFLMRSQIIKIIRRVLDDQNFMEVETPILQNIYGGAAARPFTTKLHALDQQMFLRIALEISLKKLLVGGMERIYEINKTFRNEGIDRTHNPEFTMLEMYAAYWDYNDMMELTENLFETIALTLFNKTQLDVDRDGKTYQIELKAPWKRLSMKDAIYKYAGVEIDDLTDDEIRQLLENESDLDPYQIKKAPRGNLIAMTFEELVEMHLIQPHHIIDHPIETTPLCKLHRDPKRASEGLVERFESFILGGEMCNAYSELNDPILQRELLEKQALMKQQGDEEANPLDEDFVEAICQGMPPAGGLGIGIDRLVMLFANVPSIRDVLYFPLMKLEE